MKFIMLVIEPHHGPPPSEEDMKKIHAECSAWHNHLVETGKSTGCAGLKPPAFTKSVTKKPGRLTVIDGPFIESKEVLGGFEMLECKDIDEAVQIVSTFPALDWGVSVEVRQVFGLEDH
jgi:hypothetical protein